VFAIFPMNFRTLTLKVKTIGQTYIEIFNA